ncbi:MAG: hypothetical protein HYT78_11535 [Deltaproteobacteria bacterium]|nr:hypothetical protein [Deltaproteobacteria bacterium]
MKKPHWTSTFLPASAVTWAVFAFLFYLAYRLDPTQFPLTGIVCLAGYILGMPIGMAASPYKKEGSHFQALAGLVTSFLSGIVAGKLAELDFEQYFMSTPLNGGRALLFLSFSVLSMVQTFIFRRYFDTSRAHDIYQPTNQDGETQQPKQEAPKNV